MEKICFAEKRRNDAGEILDTCPTCACKKLEQKEASVIKKISNIFHERTYQMGIMDDMWDGLCDNVICPAGRLIADGIEATGRGIDTIVTSGIEVVGGGIDYAIDTVKEHPIEFAVGAVVAVATGGTSLLANTAVAGALGVVGSSSVATAGAIAATSGLGTGGMLAAAKSLTGTNLARIAAAQMITGVGRDLLREKVKPAQGSVLFCDLGAIAEHSGIYVGNGKIAHLGGSGGIEIVTAGEFLGRLGGWNPAFRIYVSCDENGTVGSGSAARIASAMQGRQRNYNVILDNCHQFTSGCVTGDFENSDNFLWMLKNTAAESMNATSWRVWDLT